MHLNNNRYLLYFIYHNYIFISVYLNFKDISYHILLLLHSLGYFSEINKPVYLKIPTSNLINKSCHTRYID